MKFSILAVFLAVASLCFVSCAPSTPAYRISESPQAFERLSPKEKELVSRGEISKGMGQDAVTLAWGNPERRLEGQRGGRSTERWEYRGTQAVVTNGFFGGYTSSYYGRFRYGGFGPQVTYVPYTRSMVLFVGGRVEEWERVK